MALFFSLAGCADTPKEYNPIEWGRSAARGVESLFGRETPESPPIADAPPAEGRPYPNLASVPKPPRTTPQERAQRQADIERLSKDREAALADDQSLRDSGALPKTPPAELRSEPETPPPPPPSTASDAPKSPGPTSPPPTARTSNPTTSPPSRPTTSPPSALQGPTPLPAPTTPPNPPPAVAQAAPPAAAPTPATPPVVRRLGSLSFARDSATLSAAGERALAEAASLARANNGGVRLVPAQVARQTIAPDLARARATAINQALARGGVPLSRVAIGETQGQRVDLYDIYVEN